MEARPESQTAPPQTLRLAEIERRLSDNRFTCGLDDLKAEWAIGANANELPAQARAVLDAELERLRSHPDYGNKPAASEMFDLLIERASAELDVFGPTQEDGPLHLSKDDQAFFRVSGVLPGIDPGLDPQLLTSLDQLFSAFVRYPYGATGMTASPAWMFDRDFLALATSEEITAKVRSVLGNDVTLLGADGPMYLPPQSPIRTFWHSASGRQFGGGSADTSLDMVTVWVALSDATVTNGCMKMIPGSFHIFNTLNQVAPELYTGGPKDIVSILLDHDYRVDLATVRKIVSRRLSARFTPELRRATASADASDRFIYNGFHAGLDNASCVGEERLIRLLETLPKITLPARRGQMHMFTSQNMHSSFANTSTGWRKAISLRFGRTGFARPSAASQISAKLEIYKEHYPATDRVLRGINRTIDQFADASPRLRISGDIPRDQAAFYVSREELEEQLEAVGGSCFPREETLPES